MKESSRFYSSLGLLIILNAIIKPLWIFAIDRQVQNVVGTEVYGNYFALFNLSIVFSFLLDWGLTIYFNRQLAAQQADLISRAGNFLFLKLIFAAVYSAIVFLAAWISGIEHWGILLSIVLIQVFLSLFLFFRSVITSQQWFQTDSWLSVLDKTLMIILCGSLLYFPAVFGSMTIHKFLFAQVICTSLAMISALVILLRRGVAFPISRLGIGIKILRDAVPFAMIVVLMSVHIRLDGFLLERMHPNGAYEAGRYAAAFRLLDAANMVGYLFASFLLPYIARQWKEKKEIETVVTGSRHFLLMFTVFIVVSVYFLAPWFSRILYPASGEELGVILQYCIPALVGYSLIHIYGTLLTATGHVILFCYITLFAVVINIVLNLLLIPSMGAKGCCIAALSSQLFCGLATMLAANRKTRVQFRLRWLLMNIFTAGFLFALFYSTRNLLINNWLLLAGAGMSTLLLMAIPNIAAIRSWAFSLRKINHNQ